MLLLCHVFYCVVKWEGIGDGMRKIYIERCEGVRKEVIMCVEERGDHELEEYA